MLGLKPFSIVFYFSSPEGFFNRSKVCFGDVFVPQSEDMLTVSLPTNCNAAIA